MSSSGRLSLKVCMIQQNKTSFLELPMHALPMVMNT